MDGPNNGIVLYHYSFSPYARKMLWYLALRGIDYAQCIQPPVLPRPDLNALNIHYRRIPVMAIGKDVYCDTRICLQKLEKMFPEGALGSSLPEQHAVEKLLDFWTTDGGVFNRASQLIPTSMPLLNDPKFTKDREDFTGRSWDKDAIKANRPEALAHMRNAFDLLETTLLADGREWITKSDKPSLADIHAIWPFHWLNGLKDALPQNLISAQSFPKVFAWIERFDKVVKEAKAKGPKPTTLKADAATKRVLSASFAEVEAIVDEEDPVGLKKGEEVEVWPTDSGSKHRDTGALLGLSKEEVVLGVKPKVQGAELRVHFPRTNFRIRAVKNVAKL